MNNFNILRVKEIPCIAYLIGFPVNMYLGPKLNITERLTYRRFESKYLVLNMHDALKGVTKEALSYTFPGLHIPEPFSADSIHDTIRETIKSQTGYEIDCKSKCIIWHDGEDFVIYVGTTRIMDVFYYLLEKDNRLKSVSEEDDTDLTETVLGNYTEASELGEDDEEPADEVVHSTEKYDLSDEMCDIRFRSTDKKDDAEGEGLLFSTKETPEHQFDHFNIAPRPQRAEDRFNYEMTQAAADVKKAIENLLLTGFPLWAIQLWLNDYVKRSRIRITKQFRIFLVDYDKEIKMGPLPKTVFLFFLRHPEGVRFSYLQDHVKELMHIYEHVSVNDDPQKMRESIEALVNPLNNSINEKCAAIKKAFLLQINDEIAKEYYVTSMLAGFKGIQLCRDLVEWECEL